MAGTEKSQKLIEVIAGRSLYDDGWRKSAAEVR